MRHLKFHWVTIIIVIMHVILNVNWFMVVFDRLWSGRAVTEHKYVFLFFCCFFFGFCVCVYMYLCRYVSNHFNHCIKLFAPCGPLIGNKKLLFLFYSYTRYEFTYTFSYVCFKYTQFQLTDASSVCPTICLLNKVNKLNK